jgi:hypothetical protein
MTKARQLADLGNVYDDGALSNRNLIINGAMQVAQRGTSVAITGGGYHTIDRWSTIANSSMSYAVTMSQESTDNDTNGFGYSLKLLTTTAQAMTGSQNYSLRYSIEGRDVKHLSYGTSDARVITLSFWVKSNKTGVFSLQVYNGNTDTNYSMLTSYNVNVANTWEYKTIVIPANTGQVMNRTSEIGMMLDFNLASGADDLVSAFSWGLNYNGAARAVTGQVNILDTVNNYFQITGVQLEVGDTATPYEHKNVGQELLACKRYFQRIAGGESGITGSAIMTGVMHNSTFLEGIYKMEVEMRTEPTLECVTGTNYYGFSRNGAQDTLNSISIDSGAGNPRQVNLFNNSQVSGTAGQAGIVFSRVEAAIISLNAEL